MSSWATLATNAAERKRKGLPPLSNFNTPSGRHPNHNNPPLVGFATRKHNTRPPTWRSKLGLPNPSRRNASKKTSVNKPPHNKSAFSVENPLTVARSRASSTVSDPAAINPYTGINENHVNESGVPFSQLDPEAKAAFMSDVQTAFGKRFPKSNLSKKNLASRMQAARNAASTRKAEAANRNARGSRAAKNKEKSLDEFSKQLSKMGAANKPPTAAQILAGYKSKHKK
jgi:hypothetical protein